MVLSYEVSVRHLRQHLFQPPPNLPSFLPTLRHQVVSHCYHSNTVTSVIKSVVTSVVTSVATGVVTGIVTGVATGAITGIAIGVVTGVVTGIVTGVATGVVTGIVASVVTGVATGVVTGVVTGGGKEQMEFLKQSEITSLPQDNPVSIASSSPSNMYSNPSNLSSHLPLRLADIIV